MRDAMWAASGELQLQPRGGRPFDAEKGVPRRSVYAFVNRDVNSRLASTFDRANPGLLWLGFVRRGNLIATLRALDMVGL